ncbi:helix-turn-helix domain-containing protein [Gordonia amicalis]|uniref:helix-turn-helix domain-containing protein n=1 Tax=Gordonia amicalis TaxID=89053 RepID=UPI002953DF9E|nr:helix-turn-helix domain-containing protein [Gordonia amicalis]MDV7101653.1 helix-turn-helix domain-containing protein [Gordonia amicalis]
MSDDGFVRLPNKLIDSGELTQSEYTVYIALLRHRDHRDGRCYPSYATIAREARVTRNTALAAIKSLENRRIIRVLREKHKSNTYIVALADRFPDASDDSDEGGAATGHPVQPLDPRGPTTALPESNHCTTRSPMVGHEVDPITRTTEVDPGNSTQEEALRSDDASDAPTGFEFTTEPESPATEKQITHLADLYIHLMGEAAPAALADGWRSLTAAEASAQIDSWLKSMPRGSNYRGPELGDAAYNRLSTRGQDAADRAMVPRTERSA